MAHSQVPVILLAFANDADAPLRELAREQDDIAAIFRQAERDGKCKVVTLAAANADKVIQAFQEYRNRIRIFHYGGHSHRDAIFLRSGYAKQTAIKADNLADFLALQEGLELVFLNSCLSLPQAEKYHKGNVNAVIATNQKVGDTTARQFAQLFYRSMATGADIKQAYHEAEKGHKLDNPDRWRDAGLFFDDEETVVEFPWQLFPEELIAPWRLPLVARRLTRIPSIDLEKEFLGREDDMQRLKDKLGNTSKVVLMNGLGGIGKTVLAKAYLQQFGDRYDHLAWINRGEDLINAIALNEYLADTLGIPFVEEEELQDRFYHILRKLQQLPGQNLLVIDNAQDQVAQKDIYEHLPGNQNWKVLLTSRLNLGGFDRLPLGTLAPEAARQLFQTHFTGEHTAEELEVLLAEIGYHTLTVELLAKVLDKLNNVLSISELTGMLQQKQLNDPDLQEKVWTHHSGEERGIYLHLMKAFELTQLAEQEEWLLKQFVVLPVEQYDVATLADFLQEKSLRLNKLLNSLATKGWLTQHEDKTFSIHRLIQQVVAYQLPPIYADVEALVERMIEKMAADEYTSPIAANVPWIDYAVTVADFFTEEEHEQVVYLDHNIAITYHALGQYDKALEYDKKALVILEAVLDAQHPDLASSYNNIASTYRGLGQYEQALEYDKKALDIREAVLDAQHPDLASSYNNIANTYYDRRQYEQALEYHKKALVILEAVLDAQHPDLASSYNNIASTYRGLGQYDKALEYNKKALAIREAVLDAQHPDLASSYNNIANTYYALRQYEQALEYYKKALVIQEAVLDAQHPDLASSYNNIAGTYLGLGQYEQALEYDKKALDIREAVLDAQHPDLASSYNNIASTYRGLGQYEQALEYDKKALDIREAVLDAQHPDLASSYYNIASTYRGLGQYEQALEYHKKGLAIREAVLDAQHPDLASSYYNIANTYYDRRQYEQALEYYKKALDIREAVLDAQHPDLASSYNNIAGTYLGLGQYEQALEYYKKALDIREAVLDAQHPDLASSYYNIANTYYDRRQYEQALEYYKKALDIREAVLDAQHPDLASSYNNIAGTYLGLGQYEQALEYYKKALDIREAVLDAQHPDLAGSYNNIANTYYALRQYEQALEYYKKALAIQEAVLDENHPDLARSYHNIAITYRSRFQLLKAFKFFSKAIQIDQKQKTKS